MWSGSSVKIDETWSIEVLRVVAFSQGVVAPFPERLVNERRLVPAYWYESALVHML